MADAVAPLGLVGASPVPQLLDSTAAQKPEYQNNISSVFAALVGGAAWSVGA